MDETVTIVTTRKAARRLLSMVHHEVYRIDQVVKKNGLKADIADDIRGPMIEMMDSLERQVGDDRS